MSDGATREDDGRALLINSALDLLNEVHPEDLSIREVARRAGLSSGAPYHHFKTKSDLLAACAVVAWKDLWEQLEACEADDAYEQLLQRADTYLRFARTNPGPYRLMTSRLLDGDDRFGEIVTFRSRAMAGVIPLIMSGAEADIDPASAKLRGIALWSTLHGHVTLDANTTALDHGVARLATRMAVLPPEPGEHALE